MEVERQTVISHLLIHSPNACQRVRLDSAEARNCNQVKIFHVGGRESSAAAFQNSVSRKLESGAESDLKSRQIDV